MHILYSSIVFVTDDGLNYPKRENPLTCAFIDFDGQPQRNIYMLIIIYIPFTSEDYTQCYRDNTIFMSFLMFVSCFCATAGL